MKTSLFAALGLAACLLLSSCVIDSVNPLSSPDTAYADQRLLGDWRGKENPDKVTFHFSMAKQTPWVHVEIIPDRTGDKKDSYDLFPTVIGHTTFLNVQTSGKDDQGHTTKSYVFIRYSISPDHGLQMWLMSQDAIAAAIRSGKLKGIVHQDKNPLMIGQPPHPDMDVNLQDTGVNIVKFIQSMDATALFDDKLKPLYRVKPTGT